MSIWNICLAILVFSIIIIVHEFGHFIVAKINKVGVIEFSLGMGPRLITLGTTAGGRKLLFLKSTKYFEEHPEFEDHTLYSWKLLPFGGSCMMLGEEEEIEDERAFGKKSVYARMAIIFAGPFFNFILAFLLALIVMGCVGYDAPVIESVNAGQPMAEAGVRPGDVITEFNGRNILLARELNQYLQFHPLSDMPVQLTYERNGKEQEITVTPELVKQKDGAGSYMLGFGYNVRTRTRIGGWATIKYAAYEVKYWIVTTIESLGQMIRGKVSAKDISGPVGIVQVVGNAVSNSRPSGVSAVVLTLLNLSILLTANLGVMNLLPIPALDGGRLLLLIIEWIRRKPINQKIETYVNVTGFMLLMGLMVLIMVNDVMKIVQ